MTAFSIAGGNYILENNSEINYFIAQYGNSLMNIDTGVGYAVNIGQDYKLYAGVATQRSAMVRFLDYIFHTNLNGPNKVFDLKSISNNMWENKNMDKAPLGKYMVKWNNRLFMGHCRIVTNKDYFGFDSYTTAHNLLYKNAVFFSETPDSRSLKWGLEYGQNLFNQDGNGNTLDHVLRYSFSAEKQLPNFVANKIKVGDPIFIHSANLAPFIDNSVKYTVNEVIDPYTLRVNEKLQSLTGRYWVGSNYFFVEDEITALTVNNNRLMVFQKNRLDRYDGSSVYQVKGVVGTSSDRSVRNKRGLTIYFYGSSENVNDIGFYAYDGVTSRKISNAVDPFIRAMSSTNYDKVVGWFEGDKYRAYIGNLSSNNHSSLHRININNAVFEYNLSNQAQSIGKLPIAIENVADMEEDNQTKMFFIDSTARIYQTPKGYSFAGANIDFEVIDYPVYPRGVDVVNQFTRIAISSRNAKGVKVAYKLLGNPDNNDTRWNPLGDIDGDYTEFLIPDEHNVARGILIKYYESSTRNPTFYIEKRIIFSMADSQYTETVVK